MCARRRDATPIRSRPNSRMPPESARNSPVTRLNNVVLPAPFGPMISLRSPNSTERFTDEVTRSPPNALLRSRSSSALISHRPCLMTSKPDRPAPQPHRARHQAFRHEDNDHHEDRAKHEIPALDIGAGDVLHDDDQYRAGDWPEQRRGAAGDHHQQRLG